MIKLFKQLDYNIDSHDEIIIMTHARPDLDGMGSSIALYKIVLSMGKKCFIVKPKEKVDKSLNKAFQFLEDNNIKLDFKEEKDIINDNFNKPLLIILDTGKKDLVESEKVLGNFKDKIIIDHHIDGTDFIDDVLYKFNDASKSSIVEVISEYLEYLNIKLEPLIFTILLSGMVVDTSNFNIKTTSRTFEMASFLAKNGADFILMQEILKQPKDVWIKRYEFINKSKEIADNVLLCEMDDKIHGNVDIALLAKELLKFEDIEASFAIGHLSKRIVGVSARSMGRINVGEIMERLGGGGHLTDAAAQIKDKSIKEISDELKKIVKDVVK